MKTDFEKLVPNGLVFNLREIEKMRIIKVSMAKKLISKGKLEAVKIGNKLHISRTSLINYLEDNTTSYCLNKI